MSRFVCLLLLYTFQVIHGYKNDYTDLHQGNATKLYTDSEALHIFQTETEALNRFQNVKRRSYRRPYRGRRACRQWNSHCFPWAKRTYHACCNNRGLSCQCNLWMQNCRCVSKLWGR